jgi:AraC family transcriptional activator FtrA
MDLDTKKVQINGALFLRIIKWFLRALAYLGSFVLPIILVGGIGFSMSLQHSVAGPPTARRAAALPQPAPSYDPHKPTVAIVLGDVSDANDMLAPYALFAESGAYNVYTVAATRDLRSLTDGLDIVPHYSFAELEARLGHSPDIIVVPAIPNIRASQNQPMIDWIKRQAQQPTMLFSWCMGAEVLAASGVLDGKAATAHWGGIDQLERAYPAVHWQRDVRYVDQGRIITAAGLTSGIDATLHLLNRLYGCEMAERVAHSIQYPSLQFVDNPAMPQYRPELSDSIAVLNGGFAWPKQQAGVWLYNGVGELDLAAVLEVYGATWTYQVDTLAAAPAIFSQHGLQLIPRWQTPHLPRVDRLLAPGGRGVEQVASTLTSVQEQVGAPITVLADPAAPRYVYEVALSDLARHQNVPTARYDAKRLEYRADTLHLSGPEWPLQVIVVPLLLGSLGVGVTRWLLRRKRTAPQARRCTATLQQA